MRPCTGLLRYGSCSVLVISKGPVPVLQGPCFHSVSGCGASHYICLSPVSPGKRARYGVSPYVYVFQYSYYSCIYRRTAPAIINRLGGSLLAGGFLALVNLLSRGGVGWGDVKLFAASGLLIGAAPAITALLMGYVAAGLWYAVPLVRGRVGRKTQIPMAPFFAVSLMVCGLWFRQLFLWYLGFFR